MIYVFCGMLIAIIAFVAGKQQAESKTHFSADSDKRFIEAAYESGRSTQQMFIVQEVSEPYVSKNVNVSTVRQAQNAKARLQERNAKVLPENLLPHLRKITDEKTNAEKI